MPMDPEVMILQLDQILDDFAGARAAARFEDLSDLPVQSLQRLAVRQRASIDRCSFPGSSYSAEARALDAQPLHVKVPGLIGIVQALRDDLSSGWLSSAEELVHADLFSEIFEQARELLDKGYEDPAAVVIGTVLESQIKLLAVKYSIDPYDSNGRPKNVDRLRADLVKDGAFNKIVGAQITSWLAIRNAAAHGDFGEYDDQLVRDLLRDVAQFLASYPA